MFSTFCTTTLAAIATGPAHWKPRLLCAALALTAASFAAPTLGHATPINYTVSGTTDLAGDTETITGSFTFDTSNSTESNVTITLTGAAPFAGTYTRIAPFNTTLNSLIEAQSTTAVLGILFVDFLNVSPDNIAELEYQPTPGGIPTFDRSPTGSATFAVPEPASLPLLAMGLAGLGMVRRTRRG